MLIGYINTDIYHRDLSINVPIVYIYSQGSTDNQQQNLEKVNTYLPVNIHHSIDS